MTLLTSLLLLMPSPAIPASGADAGWVAAELPGLLDLYRHLHRHPELSYQEAETAGRVALELERAGVDEITKEVGGHGVVGVIRNGEGPTVLVRTDLDALPVVEQTGLPFASTVEATDDAGEAVGVMHACGHDVHMTCFVGVARWLASHRDSWSGTVVLVAQPAEERVGGARRMLEDGLYERFPRPEFALALHVSSETRAGQIAYRAGPALASVSSVDITVRGEGGHGAYPHRTVDPIVLAASLVMELQTIVSREVAPTDPAVVTVGSIHGGAKHNIIPPEVTLQLTLRSYTTEVMDQLIDGIRRRAFALAEAHEAPEPSVTIGESTPPTVNDPDLVSRIVPALGRAIGPEHVHPTDPVMGAEDFSLYSLDGEIPSFMFWLGAVPADRFEDAQEGGDPLPSLHSPIFAPDAPTAVPVGIRAMTSAVVELLPPPADATGR
ncbi:amidohydrolase [Tautonia plasticadhaerens]|uniref:Putative hydrolase YxeP n=1 Tax=Tautonia plasticadhaerens TaxID=2527974 RepID=A0A518GY27_9BACT|nr:amidohydrolase [Tautonia plasticadhaerens]QDV33504.1 putative hydrolase YxeP [Tautonia plasticadhaerens]